MVNQARQVFYVEDPLDSNWFVVFSTQARNVSHKDDSDDYVLEEHNTCVKKLVDIDAFDNVEVTTGSYAYKASNGIWVDKII